jgi:hypothetical protein
MDDTKNEENQVDFSSSEQEMYVSNPLRNKKPIVHNEPFYKANKIDPVKMSFSEDSIEDINKKVLKNKELFTKNSVGQKIVEQYQQLPSVGSEISWLTPELYNAPIKATEVESMEEEIPSLSKLEVNEDQFSLLNVKQEEYFIFYNDEVIACGSGDLIKEKIADLYTINGEDFDVDQLAVFKRIKPRVGILLDE